MNQILPALARAASGERVRFPISHELVAVHRLSEIANRYRGQCELRYVVPPHRISLGTSSTTEGGPGLEVRLLASEGERGLALLGEILSELLPTPENGEADGSGI